MKPDTAPFAELQAALDSGMLSVRTEDRPARRILPNVAPETRIRRDARVRLGAYGERVPDFRRTVPRA